MCSGQPLTARLPRPAKGLSARCQTGRDAFRLERLNLLDAGGNLEVEVVARLGTVTFAALAKSRIVRTVLQSCGICISAFIPSMNSRVHQAKAFFIAGVKGQTGFERCRCVGAPCRIPAKPLGLQQDSCLAVQPSERKGGHIVRADERTRVF